MYFKKRLTWKRPLFYALLPIFFVMAFLGFPIPVAPPGRTKPSQEESIPVKKRKRLHPLTAAEQNERAKPPDANSA
jgi:hypothetical protein